MPEKDKPEDYTFLGEGEQGRVFRLSPGCCIKVYKDKRYAARETRSYEKAQGSPAVPKLYETGPNYIIIEYINGPTLEQYLQEKGTITESLAKQIIDFFKELKRIGFTRIDAKLRHIYVTENEQLRMIDLTNCYRHVHPIPRMVLEAFEDLGLLGIFLEHVKNLDPRLYSKWRS